MSPDFIPFQRLWRRISFPFIWVACKFSFWHLWEWSPHFVASYKLKGCSRLIEATTFLGSCLFLISSKSAAVVESSGRIFLTLLSYPLEPQLGKSSPILRMHLSRWGISQWSSNLPISRSVAFITSTKSIMPYKVPGVKVDICRNHNLPTMYIR